MIRALYTVKTYRTVFVHFRDTIWKSDYLMVCEGWDMLLKFSIRRKISWYGPWKIEFWDSGSFCKNYLRRRRFSRHKLDCINLLKVMHRVSRSRGLFHKVTLWGYNYLLFCWIYIAEEDRFQDRNPCVQMYAWRRRCPSTRTLRFRWTVTEIVLGRGLHQLAV